MLNFDSPLWSLVIDLLLIGIGITVSIIGYLLKSKIEKVEADRTKLEVRLEKKLDQYFAQVRNEMAEVEKAALGVKSDLHQSLSELPDKFVPRYELQEIVRTMRVTQEHNAQGVERMDKKLDNILMLLMEKEKK